MDGQQQRTSARSRRLLRARARGEGRNITSAMAVRFLATKLHERCLGRFVVTKPGGRRCVGGNDGLTGELPWYAKVETAGL
jgi:hypothetical protein